MKFSCEKAILQEAVSICSRAVSSKSAVPVLEGLMIQADEYVTISGFDLKTGIKCSIPATIPQKGSIVLNARIFGDIIRKLPDDIIEISVNDRNMAEIKCAMSEFNIIGSPAEEFPELPEVEKGKRIIVSGNKLKSMISETIFAVSENENKPIHTGALMEIEDDTLTMVAVDGYRLALRKEKIERADDKKASFVVPGNALREIEKIIPDTEDPIEIYPDKKHILFDIDGTIIISRLLEGEFLNYKNAIPKDHTIVYHASSKKLTESVERVSLIISEKLKNPIRCVFDYNLVKISCVTAIGKAYDECEMEGQADKLEIGFNNRYLLDALKACPDDNVLLELKSGLSPCVIKPEEGDAYLYLVLPVRLKAAE